MNLFATSSDPVHCAQALDDKRVGKMIMETNQMLSLTIKHHLPTEMWEPYVGEGMLTAGYAHQNHPVSKWMRQSYSNFYWSLLHATALSKEFLYRFNKRHASSLRTEFIKSKLSESVARNMYEWGITPFHNSARNKDMGIDFTHVDDVHKAYKSYLNARWATDKRPVTWTNRSAPSFYKS